MSPFAATKIAPRDPILGLNEAFTAEQRSDKVNLCIGVYYDAQGRLPLLQAIAQAESYVTNSSAPHAYLPIDGLPAYDLAVQTLLFGATAPVVVKDQVVTVQTLGGTGALRVGADFLKQLLPDACVAISDPSWENHRAIFEGAGFRVRSYRYYDATKRGLDRAGLRQDLESLPAGSIVVLHACCHNPTGIDLSHEDWRDVLVIVQAKQLVPFIDFAYQGFDRGIEEDTSAVRLFAEAGVAFLVASSFSKSFSLYGERVGALHLVTQGKDEADRVRSQIKRVVRTNYSSPPTYGAALVAKVLTTPMLRQLWEVELNQMRERIHAMRLALVQGLAEAGDFSFIQRQRGMFSYSGLDRKQVEELRSRFGIYLLDSGRINLAALNERNLSGVTTAIAETLRN